jgi:aryl-alcohol dehydrogenase-like predicted oxidoreductase
MSASENTRRDFLKTTTAAMAGAALAPLASQAAPEEKSKILNHNPKMTYRRLGKTGLMISEVSLGGHGGSSPADRQAVLQKAVELGMNYLDTNIVAECALYGQAMDRSKPGLRREDWFIGFATWPTKLTTDYEKELTPEKLASEIDDILKIYKTDTLDLWRPVGATWGAGQNNINTLLEISDRVLEMVVGVFEKAQKAGKVRFLGLSAHNPKVFRKVLTKYPQYSVVIFPYLFLTKEFGGDSLLKLAQEKDVGVIGLKPFGAGTTFGLKPQQIKGKIDPRAHHLVKEMLQEKRLSAIIPGVNIPEQLEENVKGSYERDQPKTSSDEKALRECTENFYAHLTPHYQWLRLWETV